MKTNAEIYTKAYAEYFAVRELPEMAKAYALDVVRAHILANDTEVTRLRHEVEAHKKLSNERMLERDALRKALEAMDADPESETALALTHAALNRKEG